MRGVDEVGSPDICNATSARDSKILVLDPNIASFPENILELADVPVAWLWCLLKNKSQFKITDEMIADYSKKSTKLFRTAFSFLTGNLIVIKMHTRENCRVQLNLKVI